MSATPISELNLVGRMKAGWAEKRAPFEKLIGKRVRGTDGVNEYEGILVSVSKMALTATILDDKGPKHIVWCSTLVRANTVGLP